MSFEPCNLLERSLVQAAKDPAHRPQFYKDFVASDIFIIQHGEPPPNSDTRQVLAAGKTIKIEHLEYNGKLYIPIFSSLERLQVALTAEAAYLGINALDFLKMTQGSPLLLNPGSVYGKEFTEPEVASLIDGSIWNPSEQYVVRKPTQVLFGQPKNYPNELVQTLTRLFATMPEIKRAWLAHYFNPERDEKPHTLIAIEHSGQWDRVAGQAGMVAREVRIPDPPVDFMELTGSGDKGGAEHYFLNSTEPFYKKGSIV
ncbi:MAG TPA: enhanced serine sensitivity protein SseB C-terminal domain-containing protein [Blastocatellia bacterium]|nr:enhanced serine sensitivity protein SseB C-terminal domain-containing protein [Blastocatellia bacterium]